LCDPGRTLAITVTWERKHSRETNPTKLNERPMSLTGDYQPDSLIASPVDERVWVGTDEGNKIALKFSARSPPAGQVPSPLISTEKES